MHAPLLAWSAIAQERNPRQLDFAREWSGAAKLRGIVKHVLNTRITHSERVLDAVKIIYPTCKVRRNEGHVNIAVGARRAFCVRAEKVRRRQANPSALHVTHKRARGAQS